MVKTLAYEPAYDIVPQAIFWRPLNYFTLTIRKGEDGLDIFTAASFAIGNKVLFDLRSYRGHPEYTVTLYLPKQVDDPREISESISLVIKEMVIPSTAVAWRRGLPFEHGTLERPREDRLREGEARILALKIAAQRLNHRASTTFIKSQIPNYTQLSAADRAPSKSRRRESAWQQVIGNVISHKSSPTGPFATGHALRTPDGLSVTRKGVDYLNNMGFSVPV